MKKLTSWTSALILITLLFVFAIPIPWYWTLVPLIVYIIIYPYVKKDNMGVDLSEIPLT